MIYTEKFKMGAKDIGKDNKIKNRAILEMLENIATRHSDEVGYGIKGVEKTKLSWILLDWKLEVINRPKYGQTLTINTWAKGVEKFFTYRDYEIYDENNNLCVIATSKWVLINLENGKMTRLTTEIIDPYKPEEKNVFPTEKLDKLEMPKEFTSDITYKVTRRDIDINNHMHNLYYLDLAYEALPEEVYQARPFNHIRITYKKEIKLRRYYSLCLHKPRWKTYSSNREQKRKNSTCNNRNLLKNVKKSQKMLNFGKVLCYNTIWYKN